MSQHERSTRRERRKAKQSGFRREPRKAGIVGHGGASGPGFGHIDIATYVEQESDIVRARRNYSKTFTTIGEILWSKGIDKL